MEIRTASVALAIAKQKISALARKTVPISGAILLLVGLLLCIRHRSGALHPDGSDLEFGATYKPSVKGIFVFFPDGYDEYRTLERNDGASLQLFSGQDSPYLGGFSADQFVTKLKALGIRARIKPSGRCPGPLPVDPSDIESHAKFHPGEFVSVVIGGSALNSGNICQATPAKATPSHRHYRWTIRDQTCLGFRAADCNSRLNPLGFRTT
jgi:hypothetical protein